MNEDAPTCPVTGTPEPMDSLWPWRHDESQSLVREPYLAGSVLKEAEDYLVDYYRPVSDVNPDWGEYKIARTLRDVALSAALHISATRVTQRILRALEQHNDSGTPEPFPLADHVEVLPDLKLCDYQTPECRQFAKIIGGMLFQWMKEAVIYGDPLAKAVAPLHKRFVKAERQLGIERTTEDLWDFARLSSEKTAMVALSCILSAAVLALGECGAPLEPVDMASDMFISYMKPTRDLASVSRAFALRNLWRIQDQADGRSQIVVAYEAAVAGDQEPEPISNELSYFRLGPSDTDPCLPSLADGPWREPRMCIGFDQYITWADLNLRYNLWRAACKSLRVIEDLDLFDELRYRANAFSTVELSLLFGGLAAIPTVYTRQPKVSRIAKRNRTGNVA